jgi:pimeloyl-ACP methyl ester carboxylesterase
MSRRTIAAVATTAVVAMMGAVAPGASAAVDQSPAGTNNFACRPTASHPRPLVLLEGLGGNSGGWAYMAPGLLRAGYCVFTITYGVDPRIAWFPVVPEGTIPMEQSSGELAAFVDRVLAATGAPKVDLIGHSEGTVMPRWYLERRGGVAKVQKFIALTPLWRGTELGGTWMMRDGAPPLLRTLGLDLVASLCGSCPEFIRGSDYLNDLNADGEAIKGIEHTNIATKYDELVKPYTSGLMSDGGTNIVVQDICPRDYSEHLLVAFDPVVAQLMLNALDPAHATPVIC